MNRQRQSYSLCTFVKLTISALYKGGYALSVCDSLRTAGMHGAIREYEGLLYLMLKSSLDENELF